MILLRQLSRSFFEKAQGIDRNDITFLSGGFDNEWTLFRFAKVGHRVQKVECVLGPQVEGITLESYFHFGSSLVHLSLSLIHISEPTRLLSISYAVFCLK